MCDCSNKGNAGGGNAGGGNPPEPNEQYRFEIRGHVRYLSRRGSDVFIKDSTGYSYYKKALNSLPEAQTHYNDLLIAFALLTTVI